MDKRKILIFLWLAGILFPYNWFGRGADVLRHAVRMAVGSEPAHIAGHLVLFGGLIVLVLHGVQIPFTRRSAICLAVLVLAIGLGQEYFQLQIKQRSFGWPEIFDLGVDLIGGALGWTAYRHFLRYRRYLRMAYFLLREA